MYFLAVTTGIAGVLFSGAIFGFFYAWVCSTMWGLDAAPPELAIGAMQAMNASVRNIVFAPAFFGTPVVLGLAGLVNLAGRYRLSGVLFLVAAAVYAVGGMWLTITVNVPMNEALAGVTLTPDYEGAEKIWADYSGPWQFWNQLRTVFSGVSLAVASAGLVALGSSRRDAR
jgi:uncharacterized membrane protein